MQTKEELHVDHLQVVTRDIELPVTQVHDIQIALVASGDGMEVMRHRMETGSTWTLMPETVFNEMQCCYVVGGTIHWKTDINEGQIGPGDALVARPAYGYIELYAYTDVEYLLISSKPIFHLHTHGLRDVEQLAVSIEQKDGYTADHCSRIKRLSVLVAEMLGVLPREQFDTKIGAFLHDVGKIRIPDEILNKCGPLSSEEWEIMRMHPIYGRDTILNLQQACLEGASQVVLQHHERYDGSGYPYGLKGNEIHIGAAIVAVVDSFDAMTTDRVYRRAKPVEQAIEEIRAYGGKLYHPDVVDAFLSLEFGY